MRTHDLTTIEGVLSALNINPEWPIERREQAIKLECANYNALVEIASALNCDGPTSTERVSGIVSAVWALKHKSSEVGAVARHDEGLAVALRADLAAKDASLKTAHAALTRICEVIGAPAPCVAEDAVEAVKTLHAAAESAQSRATQFEGDLCSIGLALNDAGAPTVYDMPDDSERPIRDLERIRILGARVRTDRGEREQEALRAQRHADYLRDAHVELDYCGAPKLADGVAITPAARIRAYVEMVTAPTEDPSIALRQWTRDVWREDDSL